MTICWVRKLARSETLQLILVHGDDEALVAVVSQERYPNELGVITPPITITHEGTEYILNRNWMQGVYLYHPSNKVNIDDLLGS